MSYPHQPSDDDFAQLQKLSNEYEPESTGPLVGPRQSTAAITTEYANGDPVYQAKTQALPYKYSQYRTCRGDGHCGWRGTPIAFGYFEALQRLGDSNKLLEEQTRLGSLANLLNQTGHQQDLWEDFAEATFDLLRDLRESLPNADEPALMNAFNDEMVSLSIITHLKLLTSAWMQTHRADFEPYLLGTDIRQYCAQSIEASVAEIEHVGLTALFQVLLKPAGLALEILYLDRSAGEEGNMYRFDASGHDGLPLLDAPTIRLLYRPGHYDILYKAEDMRHPTTTQVAVNLAPHISNYDVDSLHDRFQVNDALTSIPMSSILPSLAPSGYLSAPFGFPSTSEQPARNTAPPVYTPLPNSHAPPGFGPQSLPFETSGGVPMDVIGSVERRGPFRPSQYELTPDFSKGSTHSVPFQTSIFKNSHYNTAHFLNPDFQPEEWTPDAECVPHNRSRHKSTSQ
ncbi:cysteine proteinase [Saccharata proteae CBS 121410]|uniref:ubiquitinyl hydrolase 1 n=1 Tax=Saccharata proteae CBS 121410 TaxID=1314787 RepID=A0A9P4I150_9PEZI|nr:cysteine proteinase [Saccharata proteae CBS 121410]